MAPVKKINQNSVSYQQLFELAGKSRALKQLAKDSNIESALAGGSSSVNSNQYIDLMKLMSMMLFWDLQQSNPQAVMAVAIVKAVLADQAFEKATLKADQNDFDQFMKTLVKFYEQLNDAQRKEMGRKISVAEQMLASESPALSIEFLKLRFQALRKAIIAALVNFGLFAPNESVNIVVHGQTLQLNNIHFVHNQADDTLRLESTMIRDGRSVNVAAEAVIEADEHFNPRMTFGPVHSKENEDDHEYHRDAGVLTGAALVQHLQAVSDNPRSPLAALGVAIAFHKEHFSHVRDVVFGLVGALRLTRGASYLSHVDSMFDMGHHHQSQAAVKPTVGAQVYSNSMVVLNMLTASQYQNRHNYGDGPGYSPVGAFPQPWNS